MTALEELRWNVELAEREEGIYYSGEYLNGLVSRVESEFESVKAKNAKLRELAEFVLEFTTMTDGCGDTCPYASNNCKYECYFRKRAQELGI